MSADILGSTEVASKRFASLEAGRSFVLKTSRAHGVGLTNRKSRPTFLRLCCSCSRRPRFNKVTQNKVDRGSIKTNCKYTVYVRRCRDGQWRITTTNTHNHGTLPPQLVPSVRKPNEEQWDFIQTRLYAMRPQLLVKTYESHFPGCYLTTTDVGNIKQRHRRSVKKALAKFDEKMKSLLPTFNNGHRSEAA